MKRKTLLFLFTLLLITSAFAQKRTTSLKGYYRKNGTYVSPHTIGYTAGSGTTSQYSSISSVTSKDDELGLTTLKFINKEAVNDTISSNDNFWIGYCLNWKKVLGRPDIAYPAKISRSSHRPVSGTAAI